MKLKLFLFLTLQISCLVIVAQQPAYIDSTFTNYFRRNSGGWTAGDATISIPLPDQRVIWLFGDSYLADVDTTNNTLPCLFQVRNCMMVQDSSDRSRFKTIIDSTQTGVNQTPFKLKPNDTTLFWPGHGYAWGNNVYIFQERYSNSNMGAYYGEYIAVLHLPDLHMTGLYPAGPKTDNIFGRTVLVDSVNNWVYIYGNRLNWIVWEPIVARCRPDNPFGSWEFYTETGWSTSLVQLKKIMEDPVSPSFSIIRRQGKYYLITQENGYLECGLGRQIYSYDSDSPTGPFLHKKTLYTEESTYNGNYLLTYNSQAHPYFTENDELLISYNVNDKVDSVLPYTCPSQCLNIWNDRLNADTYRPKFIRVPMELLAGQQEIKRPLKVAVNPNPLSTGAPINLDIRNTGGKDLLISLSTTTGQVIFEKSSRSIPGDQHLTLSAPSSPGAYLLRVSSRENLPVVAKLIVIR